MFLIIIYSKMMCINYTKLYQPKNKRKLKIILFECSKNIRTDEKFSLQIRNICQACLFILEQNVFIV